MVFEVAVAAGPRCFHANSLYFVDPRGKCASSAFSRGCMNLVGTSSSRNSILLAVHSPQTEGLQPDAKRASTASLVGLGGFYCYRTRDSYTLTVTRPSGPTFVNAHPASERILN